MHYANDHDGDGDGGAGVHSTWLRPWAPGHL